MKNPQAATSAEQQHNVANLLRVVSEQQPDKTALVFQQDDREESISFGQLWQAAGSFGSGLKKTGFEPCDRAIIMIPMSIDLYVALLAVIKIGGVAVFVDPWIAPNKIAQFSAFAEPTAFIGIGKSHLLRLFHSRLRNIPISVTNGRKFLRFPARYSLNQLCQSPTDRNVHPVRPDDSALITFTSGSSGEPKGANRTHRFLSAQHEALSHEFPYVDDDIDMPMFPVFALNNLVTGLTSIVPEMDFREADKLDGNLIASQMARHGVTTVTASPPLIDRVAQHLENQAAPIRLRRILTGGAPVTDTQLTGWIRQYPTTELVVAYGSTEAEPVAHIVAQERLKLAAVGKGFCTGIPSDLIESKIIPIEKGPIKLGNRSLEELALEDGQIGELVVSGEHVCRDYFKNETATRENKIIFGTDKLWHRMGDTGYFDSAGRFWLVGRVHSTIYRDSQWIHPQLVEQVVRYAAPQLSQVAAMGCPDEKLGEKLVVIGVVDQSDSTGDELRSKIITALEQSDIPFDQVQLTTARLPLDPRHKSKIDYAQAKTMLLNGEFT